VNEVVLTVLIALGTGFLGATLANLAAARYMQASDTRARRRLHTRWLSAYSDLIKRTNRYSIGPLLAADAIVWRSVEDKPGGWRISDVDCYDADCTYVVPPKMRKSANKAWREAQKNKNATSEPGARCGVQSLSFDANERLQLCFKHTDYEKFVGTNMNYERLKEQRLLEPTDADILEQRDAMHRLSESRLSMDLGTAAIVITRDKKLLLSQRSSSAVLVLPGVIGTSIGEGMIWERDQLDGAPNPFLTLARGAQEELGLTIGPDQFRILAVGMYRPYARPIVLARADVDQDYADLASSNRTASDEWEGKVFAVDFDVPSLAPFLFDRTFGGVDLKTGPLCKPAIAMAMVDEWGYAKTERSLLEQYRLLTGSDALQ
jgi:hypothetical protein